MMGNPAKLQDRVPVIMKVIDLVSCREAGGGERKNTSNVPDCIRFATWNIGTMTGRSAEVVETLHGIKIDVCSVQETRWTGSGARVMGKGMPRYKFFWQDYKDDIAGVGLLISDRWIDKIIDVKRVNECIMCLKVLISDKLVTCICAYAPQTGRSGEEKDSFWDLMISVTGSIPASELIIVGGDLNGHVGTNVDGYDGVHGGYGLGERNADGERILEFCDAMELIVTNTCFKRQKNKLANYVSGGTLSVIDYLLLRECDRRHIKNVKVIAGQECITA